jgi:antibiotic biosynthesis monooxygenase (ABM) superfamily enzyme
VARLEKTRPIKCGVHIINNVIFITMYKYFFLPLGNKFYNIWASNRSVRSIYKISDT